MSYLGRGVASINNRKLVAGAGTYVADLKLDRMLHDAGLLRADCFLTNICRVRPPRTTSLSSTKSTPRKTASRAQRSRTASPACATKSAKYVQR